jgi:hypothetical protein
MHMPQLTRRDWLVAGAGLALRPAVAGAAIPAEVAAALPAARLQGSGRVSFFGLRVYEARLWVGEQPVADDWIVPLALEIQYLRALDGEKIAERSLEEMRRQGEIAADTAQRWLQQMKQAFPDVREGDRLTGVKVPPRTARFFHNGRLRGEVHDPEFARRFFGIWLSPQTSDPTLRQALVSGGRT